MERCCEKCIFCFSYKDKKQKLECRRFSPSNANAFRGLGDKENGEYKGIYSSYPNVYPIDCCGEFISISMKYEVSSLNLCYK